MVFAFVVIGGVLGLVWQYPWLVSGEDAPVSRPVVSAGAQLQVPMAATVVQSDWIVSGYLVARRESLVSSEVTARIRRLLVTEGVQVAEGQVIAELDDKLADADLSIAKARAIAAERSVAAAQAELVEAESVVERTRKLVARNLSSPADLGKDEARFQVLTAEYEKAQADREMVALKADRAAAVVAMHTITAPFAGTVSNCAVEVGETVSPMSATGSARDGICTIVDTSSIEVELDVPEKMLRRVPMGTKVPVVLDAYPDEVLIAKVREIAPVVSREKSTIKIRLAFGESDPRLRPNMAVKVNLQDQRAETSE
ncbi:MAG: efflux RND transporter periplasmic adaptor subunit [Pseudomonadota bacterium]